MAHLLNRNRCERFPSLRREISSNGIASIINPPLCVSASRTCAACGPETDSPWGRKSPYVYEPLRLRFKLTHYPQQGGSSVSPVKTLAENHHGRLESAITDPPVNLFSPVYLWHSTCTLWEQNKEAAMKKNRIAMGILAGTLMLAGVLFTASPAQAQSRFSIGIGVGPGYYAPPPGVYRPHYPGPGYYWTDGGSPGFGVRGHT